MDPNRLHDPLNPANPNHRVQRASRWNRIAVILMLLAAAASLLPLYRGTMGYEPSYREPAETGAATPALVPRLVMVIIDGMRYDLSEQMPCLQGLRAKGASGKSIAAFPSYSQPTWTTLVSGARPEISGAALFNAAYESIEPIQVATIFEMAKEAGLTTALAGQAWWSKMVPAEHLDYVHFVEEFDAAGDAEAAEAAAEFCGKPEVDLLVLYLGEYDELNHSVGALSTKAMEAVERSDRALCTLVSQIDLGSTVVVVTADHGQMDQAGHGGNEPEVLEAPLVIAGPRVRPGSYPDVQQPDIPATISALLGTPFSRSGQGRALYEWLDVTEAEAAQGEVALAAQKIAWAGAYLASIRGQLLPAELEDGLVGPEASLQAGDWSAARGAALTLQEQVGQHVDGERAARIARSRWLSLPLVLLGLGLLALLFALNIRATGWAPALCALVGGAAYHGFYLLRGHVYSLSTLSSVGSPVRPVVSLVMGAVLALALGIGLMWLVSRHPATARSRPLSRSIPAFCAALVGLFFALALGAWLVNGSLGGWILVKPYASFLLALSVVQVILTGLLGLLAMAGAGVGSWRLRRRQA